MKRGYIYLINTESNTIEKEINYNIKQEPELKKAIKERYLDSGRYILKCGCNPEIELGISKENSRTEVHNIYHKVQKDVINHHRLCPYSAEYKKSVYFPGWHDDKNTDSITATVDFSLTPRFSQESKRELNKDIKPIINNHFTGVTEGKLTLTALSKRLCVMTWNNKFIDAEDRFPVDRYELMRKIYGATRHIQIKTGGGVTKNLQDIYFNAINDKPFKATCCGEEGYRYVYADLIDIYPNLDRYTEGIYTVKGMVSMGEDKLMECTFTVHKNLLTESLVESGIVHKKATVKKVLDIIENKNEKMNLETLCKIIKSKNAIITGFVARRGSKSKRNLEFYKLGFLQTNEKGLYSESSYEQRFYDMHCENEILFYKPFEPILEYNLMIPDMIYKTDSNKIIFGEVFGITDNFNGYQDRKELKRRLIREELKDTHKLIEWDLTEDSSPPSIESVKEKLKGHIRRYRAYL